MGVKSVKGFSIIEVILFLGITGIIMAVLLGGITVALNRERYRDATNSFHDYMQGQYNSATNVNNTRANTEVCKSGAILQDSTADTGRGTSDCTIVGRVIYGAADGASVSTAAVYATVDAATLSGDDDVAVLQAAKLIASPTRETFTIGWDTTLVQKKSSNINVFSMLIVRSPTNGTVHTYISTDAEAAPKDIIGKVVPSEGYVICVENAGLLRGSTKTGVTITAHAVNSSGVVFAPESECV
ncbi:MAG: hypothetical protein WAQ25_01050 [Candidatus Saccharimonas sp.]